MFACLWKIRSIFDNIVLWKKSSSVMWKSVFRRARKIPINRTLINKFDYMFNRWRTVYELPTLSIQYSLIFSAKSTGFDYENSKFSNLVVLDKEEKTENFGPKPNKTPNCGHFICVHNKMFVLNFCFHHFTAWNSRDKRKRFKREKMGGDMCMVGRRVSF